MTPERLAELEELQAALGSQIQQPELLNQSLTHTSFVGEKVESRLEANQRMEFLGDAVLGLIVSHHVYESQPDLTEGQMTKIKAAAVSEPVLWRLAQKLDLGRFLLLGRGEEMTGGRQRPSILSDTLEAVVAAIYLDGGLEAARQFIIRHFSDPIEEIRDQRQGQDYKSLLQERVQERTGKAPSYQVIQEIGPDHDKRFVVEARVEEAVLGCGSGSSKKEAEQAAAARSLLGLEEETPETSDT